MARSGSTAARATDTLVTPAAAFDSGWQIFDLLVAPGDFDRDGNPDLLARKPDGTL